MTEHRPEEIVLETPRLRLAGEAWGPADGRPVLALHGWLDNAASWRPIAPMLADAGLRVVALDMPGHGLSEHPPGRGPYFFVDYVVDVFMAADSLGWDTFSLLGHSMGAGVSSLAIGTFPERIERACLVEGLGPWSNKPERVPGFLRAAIERMPDFLSRAPRVQPLAVARERVGETRRGLSESSAALLLERAIEAVDPADAPAGMPEPVRFRHDPMLRAPSILRLSESQIRAFLGAATCPVFLIGAEDGWPHDPEVLRARASCVQDMRTTVIPGHHHVHMDAPDIVGPLVREFLAA